MKHATSKDPDNDIKPVIGALSVALLPHGISVSPWIVVWCITCWGYRLLADRNRWPLPTKALRLLLTVAGLSLIVLTAGIRFGASNYMGLLAVMAALKPFEIDSYRDKVITVLLAYFIVITSLFESESPLIVFHLFGSVWITTTVLIHIHQSHGEMKSALRLSGRIMLQAAPVMLILFFLFPRLPGSLWKMSLGKKGGSGFSDSLSIGDVARLVRDDTMAFSARFDGPMPIARDLYWRGIVFDHFTGGSWTAGSSPIDPLPTPSGKHPVTYTVTLPPQGRRHLFALDLPVAEPPLTRTAAGFTLQARFPIRQKFHYRVTSELTATSGPVPPPKRLFISLPESGNPKARSLATQWAKSAPTDEMVVRAGLNYFTQNRFVYTLNPPALYANAIDQFLFETRQGYCEHYACAFVFLMRAAGIPARIIGGYLGGVPNPYGNFLTVRQSDAHAWVEVWLKGKGWVRIDPTAVVAPDRVSGGIGAALPPDELPSFLISSPFNREGSIWRRARYAWDALSNQWDIWFSGYSYLQQQALLEFLGVDAGSLVRRALLLITAIVLAVAGVAVVFFIRHRQGGIDADPALSAYRRFCIKLSRIGLVKLPSQGPLDFARYAARLQPTLATEIFEITHLYIHFRYGPTASKETLRRLKKRVRRFNVKKITFSTLPE